MNLYRYMPFETFIDMVVNERLTLLSPIKYWDDTYEGWMFHDLRLYEKEILENKNTSEDYYKMISLFCEAFVAQCWTTQENSLELWSIYSHNKKAIMIESEKEKLEKLPDIIGCWDITYGKDARKTKEEFLSMIKQWHNHLSDFYFKKRPQFEHEKEFRLFTIQNGTDKDIRKQGKRDIRISPKELIGKVMVHPSAPEWYVETVKGFCDKFNINFAGQSQLFNLE